MFFTVHEGLDYDLIVNSEIFSPEEIALQIKEFIEKKK
jgi:hypothetical protein